MKFKSTVALTLSIFLSACGGGGSGNSAATTGSAGAALGSDGASQLACTNKFGRTWTEIDTDKQKLRYFNNVAYGNGMFLGTNGDGKASSKDGENWASLPSSFDRSHVLTYAFGKFLMIEGDSFGSMVVFSTTDGTSWDSKTIGQSSANSSSSLPAFYPSDIVFGNGKLVVVGENNRIIWSTDSKTWNLAANLTDLNIPARYGFNWVAFANGKFYTATSADPRLLYISTDGNTWQAQKINGDGVFPTTVTTGMQYINGLYVAVDGNGVIANSSDGINWKTVIRGTNSPIIYGNQLVTGAGQVMTIDYQGGYSEIVYSCDGMSWAKSKVNTGTFINKIAIGENVAVKAGGKLSFSKF